MAFKTWASNDILTAADVNSYLMRQVTAVVTSTSRPSSPVYGQRITESDTGLSLRYNGSTWEPWPPQVITTSDGTNLVTSNTAYQVGSPACDFTFKGPPGGKALVTVAGHIEGSTGTAEAILTFQIRVTNSAGTIIVDTSDDNGIAIQTLSNLRASMQTLVTGLIEGTTYYIRTMHATSVSGEVVNIFYRRLLVQPLAN